MVEREREREREREAESAEPSPEFRACMDWLMEEKKRLESGVIVLKGKDKPYELGEQGICRWLCLPGNKTNATDNITMFIHHIPGHSGMHTHQGGFSLFIIEGKGYTTMDGVKYDWEEGDCVVLPVKPGGVEHQHFNSHPDKASRWLALLQRPLWETLSRRADQKTVHPEWQKRHGDLVRDAFKPMDK